MNTTFARRYSPRFGFHASNRITPEHARQLHDQGEFYATIFGDVASPTCFSTIFQQKDDGARRIDVEFLNGLQSACIYIMVTDASRTGKTELLLAAYRSAPGNDGSRFYDLFVSDVYVDGDLPTLTFDEIGNGGECHAISVPLDDFFLGPFPDFEELASGRFLDRLPKITLPPKNLWTDYIHQAVRTPDMPKRAPIGRFPW